MANFCTFKVIHTARCINHGDNDMPSCDGNECFHVTAQFMGSYCSCCSLELIEKSDKATILVKKE